MRPPTRFPHVFSRPGRGRRNFTKAASKFTLGPPTKLQPGGGEPARHQREGDSRPIASPTRFDCSRPLVHVLVATANRRSLGHCSMALALPIESMTGRFNLASWQTTFDPFVRRVSFCAFRQKRVHRAMIFIVIRKTLLPLCRAIIPTPRITASLSLEFDCSLYER